MFLYYGDDNLVVEDVKGAGLVETLKLKSLEIYVAIYQITFSWAPTRFIEMLDVLSESEE